MRLSIDNAEVYAYTGARALLPAQRSIVFVHGAANDHSVWALQSRYFAHHGHNVVAVDLPGHGRSAGSALPTVEAIADWLVRVLEAMSIERAVFVGHSMGSLATLACASHHPDRVAKVALLGCAAPMPVSDALLAAAQSDEHLAFELINSWSHSQRKQLGGNQVPGLWMTGGSMRLLERAPQGVLHTDLLACRTYVRGAEDAAALRVPALMIVGGRDIMVPPKAAQPLIKALPECQMITLAGTGHAMMAEQPDAVLDALRDFV
jgi:pimeloyl-ACP methyl ester carboxylesterase